MTIIRQLRECIDLTALHHYHPSRYPYLLQSAAQTSHQTHFDILFACPQRTLVLTAQNRLDWIMPPDTTTVRSGLPAPDDLASANGDFLNAFERCWRSEQTTGHENYKKTAGIPFGGGWFLYLGYELAQQIEPSLELPEDSNENLPIAFATRIPAAVVINRQTHDTFVVAEKAHQECIPVIENDIQQVLAQSPAAASPKSTTSHIIKSIFEEPAERYINGVNQVKRYIRDGDVFQVNLSRCWDGELNPDINNTYIYQRLLQSNPAPFAALATIGEHAIISSSPERLVRVTGNRVETRPIAGTRPRGQSANEDEAYLKELIGHPKERAEHIMLIDLERNDLGRVCLPGSVQVNELMALESYAHVHHIVSNVQGELQANTSPSDIIRAVFPGGTITGCPKVRCMEIIAELEQVPRGAYTGSLGYVNHDGGMDMNILIRTLVRNEGRISLRAGAGIVYDSDPEAELQETRAKAKGLLLAL
ncbi:MAG: aminodeoxychorismate synthase component I [Gammaproteobacteria bacterium]|jgi:anthranilate synthase component 1